MKKQEIGFIVEGVSKERKQGSLKTPMSKDV